MFNANKQEQVSPRNLPDTLSRSINQSPCFYSGQHKPRGCTSRSAAESASPKLPHSTCCSLAEFASPTSKALGSALFRSATRQQLHLFADKSGRGEGDRSPNRNSTAEQAPAPLQSWGTLDQHTRVPRAKALHGSYCCLHFQTSSRYTASALLCCRDFKAQFIAASQNHYSPFVPHCITLKNNPRPHIQAGPVICSFDIRER